MSCKATTTTPPTPARPGSWNMATWGTPTCATAAARGKKSQKHGKNPADGTKTSASHAHTGAKIIPAPARPGPCTAPVHPPVTSSSKMTPSASPALTSWPAWSAKKSWPAPRKQPLQLSTWAHTARSFPSKKKKKASSSCPPTSFSEPMARFFSAIFTTTPAASPIRSAVPSTA